jgi:hypothetical protein
MSDRDLQMQWQPARFGRQPGAIAVAAVIDVDSPGDAVLTRDVVAALMVIIRLMTILIEYTIGIKPYLDVVRALRTIYHDQAVTRENAAALVAALVSCRGIPGGTTDRLIVLYDALAHEAGWRSSSKIFVAPALGLLMTIPPPAEENPFSS